MRRQDRSELHNDEFLTLLLDVWELHLERDGAPAAAVIDADSEVVTGD